MQQRLRSDSHLPILYVHAHGCALMRTAAAVCQRHASPCRIRQYRCARCAGTQTLERIASELLNVCCLPLPLCCRANFASCSALISGIAVRAQVNRRTFVQQYGVPYRDLRILDPLVSADITPVPAGHDTVSHSVRAALTLTKLPALQLPTLFPTALFVRKQSIVVNFESLRLLIFKDHVRACAAL